MRVQQGWANDSELNVAMPIKDRFAIWHIIPMVGNGYFRHSFQGFQGQCEKVVFAKSQRLAHST